MLLSNFVHYISALVQQEHFVLTVLKSKLEIQLDLLLSKKKKKSLYAWGIGKLMYGSKVNVTRAMKTVSVN